MSLASAPSLMNHDKPPEFYRDALRILKRTKIPFVVGGSFAVHLYAPLRRSTKDLDVFCMACDYPRILQLFRSRGYRAQVEDERWIAKVSNGKYFFDLIFNAANAITPVTDEWFRASKNARICGVDVKVLAPTDLIHSKAFIQDRVRYDGADIAHLILACSKSINWKRLLSRFDQYWEVLLIHLLNFRFIYPTERDLIPRWLLDELLSRLDRRAHLPRPHMKVCRGRLFSRSDYISDIMEWGFADVVGAPDEYRDKQD